MKNKSIIALFLCFYIKEYLKMIFIVKVFANSKTEIIIDNYIKTDLFYAMSNHFYFYDYKIPKGIFSLRNHKYMSLPLYCIYNSISLFIKDILDGIIEYHKSIDTISSHWGGGYISITNDVENNKLYYMDYYKKFRKEIRNNYRNKKDNMIVIKLDIKDYFDNIDMKIMISNITKKVKPSKLKDMGLNNETSEELLLFFSFLMNNKEGIPQMENGYASSLIGFLYLLFFDMDIDSKLKSMEEIENHKIVRYVDDIYIFITIKSLDNPSVQNEDVIFYTFSSIIEILERYRLRINNKTEIFDLKEDKDIEKLKKTLSKVSSIKDKEGKMSINERMEGIYKVLTEIKEGTILDDRYNPANSNIDTELLKDLYNKDIKDHLSSNSAKVKLEEIFNDFSFYKSISGLNPIMIIANSVDSIRNSMIGFIKNKKDYMHLYYEHFLFALYLKSENQSDIYKEFGEEIEKLDIIADFKRRILKNSGYFSISFENIKK